MPVKRGNTDIADIRNKRISISVKSRSKGIFPNFVDDYISRVENDGGSITDEAALRDLVDILISNNTWPHVQGLFSPAFGIKLNASNEALKLYNVKQAEDFVPINTSNRLIFQSTGMNSHAILEDVSLKTYQNEGGENWLRNTGLAWASVACFLPMGTTNGISAFVIDHTTNFTSRFKLWRDGVSSPADRLDFSVNPEDDSSFLNLSDDQDDVASFMEFSGFIDLVDQYMHSLKDQQTLREFQGSPLPSKKFPDTLSDRVVFQATKFGFLLFANMRPTLAQRTAVFNWLDTYYAIT